ncbi:C2 and GRAM domain-containing protein [Apostasia shenzhenica]|uniref:C2 and GRAM domain-containing protein n=1 Tax=Apostasia shenzhenica TaxID=1088818 RepID=A0A2H9ZW34_9ASPA|nr:C2 and GRAM domain-containing protein [Apostasia shenzhenica]
MRLFVKVVEGRDLPTLDNNGPCDSYVKVRLGKQRAKTKAVKKSPNPFWDEEFDFRVSNLNEELKVSVLSDEKRIGHVKVAWSVVFDSENLSLGTVWYQLKSKRRKPKNRKKSIPDDISINQQNSPKDLTSSSDRSFELSREQISSFSSKVESCADSITSGAGEFESIIKDKANAALFVEGIRQVVHGRKVKDSLHSTEDRCSLESQDNIMRLELSEAPDDRLDMDVTFDELLKTMQCKDQGCEMPETLSGGVLIDQFYVISPCNLNSLLFSPGSEFALSISELQGTTDLKIEAWKEDSGGLNLKRVLFYTKAASKLFKALKAKEEQIYLKADGRHYAVLASVSVPDVPFGSYFRTEILYCITPGLELESDEQSSHLIVSWRINFLQSTMVKGMIENGARQGLNESFGLFADVLSKNVKPLEIESGSNKEQVLASMKHEPEPLWKIFYHFYGNFTVFIFIFVTLYMLLHILLASPSMIHGLEFVGLDLPDSIGEILVCLVIFVQGQSIISKTRRFFHALKLRGGNQGITSQRDGWLLTVALVEGSSLAALGSSGLSDPYVMFTCNGQKRTSSIKFQTVNPLWNELLEFDAMCDPPSRMDVVVYDFNGPFDEAVSLGHAEVNFLKSNLSELSDVWVPLDGKLAQACQSKLHLRVFLNTSNVNEVAMEYLSKMAKKVGKKMNIRSPQTNSSFQKLFCLPPEEFLVDDFACQLKRKMPLRGRLFLSQRIVGFYSNIFGNKTKFFFLWEDIDDIIVIPPSLASVGSSSLMIILHKGRGMDAQHGAKAMDQKGRLKFHFQSFVSFNAANRTIMVLWKTRSFNQEQRGQRDEIKVESLQLQENESLRNTEEVKMSEVFSSSLSVSANLLMEAFEGGLLEHKIMEKIGRLDYTVTPWEENKSKVHQRQVKYRFDKSKFRYEGEVTIVQKKFLLPDGNGWVIEEVVRLRGVLLSDCFNVNVFLKLHLKYQIESASSKPSACNVQVSLGIAWLKSTKHQKRITKSVMSNSDLQIKEMFRQTEKELLQDK